MTTYVLDSSALMAFFENRPGADRVEALLLKAADAKAPLLMSVVNWGEIYYSIWRVQGENVAETKLQEVAQLPIRIVDVDRGITREAARLKAQHSLPYADCFAAALALREKVALVTSDKDFERVRNLLRILWV